MPLIEGKNYKIENDCLTIFDGVKTILPNEFSKKDLKQIEIPNSVEVIGEYAFSNNKIKKIKLPESLIEIFDFAFSSNNISEITIPSKILRIRKGIFADNLLKKVILNKNLEHIDEYAFSNNKLKNILFPNKLNTIGNFSFMNNSLEEIEIPDSVESVGFSSFSNNNINKIKLSNNLTVIKKLTFSNNYLDQITIPKKVKKIEDYAFYNNKIKKIDILGETNTIETEAFSNNCLEQFEINKSLQLIESRAFSNNKIKLLTISNDVTKIDIDRHHIEQVSKALNNEVIFHLKKNSFVNNPDMKIKYKKFILSKLLMEKNYEIEDIIKMSDINEIIPNFDFYNMKKEIFYSIPIDNDALKGYISNKRVFNNFLEEINNNIYNENMIEKGERLTAFFKLCFTFGLFKSGGAIQEEIKNNIKKFCAVCNVDEMVSIFKEVTLNKYYPKFYETMKDAINKGYNYTYYYNVIQRYYNEHELIIKNLIKAKKNNISNVNSKKIKSDNINDIKLFDEELKKLEKNQKFISALDIDNYLKNNTYSVRKNNELLKEIFNILSSNGITYKDFDRIQDIYETAVKFNKKNPKIFNNISDSMKQGINYFWSPGDNPKNLVLGYIVNCCAKLDYIGEDIMVQSMINPNIKNLVICDNFENIIGKSTAFYNQKEKYIICNNIEVSKSFLEKNKTKKIKKEEFLDAVLRGLKDQREELEKKGLEVDEIRIGMERNELADIIKDHKKIQIKYDSLLENYKYRRYNGDANNPEFGQAVVYKKNINKK